MTKPKKVDLNQDIFCRNAYVHNKSKLFRVMGLEIDNSTTTYVRLEDAHGEWDEKLSVFKHNETRMLVQRASSHLTLAKAAPSVEPKCDPEVRGPAKASA